MKKLPSSKAPSCAVDKYIGTDFDHVVTVSKEMESVKEVAEVTEHIVVTGSNIEAIKTVATNIGDVNNVSDNMEYVKDVAAGIEGLPVVSYIGSEPPAQPVEGATWYCTTDGRTYVWYKDTDSYQWVESSPQSIAKEDVRTPIVARAALERALLLDGYTLVTGSFELGATLTKATDVILQEVTGKVYSWGGAFPATVPTGSTPDSTGGIGSNTWTLRSVPEVLKRIEAEEADTQDWKGFTEELLAQAGTTDNGQPDELGNSKRVEAISKICGRQFPDVASMITAVGLKEGQDVEWRGYYTSGDGGGNTGVVKLGPHIEDGGSIFSIDANTYIKANIVGKRLNVFKFGMMGRDAATDTAALKRAILAHPAGELFFPYPIDSYKINAEIKIPISLSLVGEGPDTPFITESGSYPNGYVFLKNTNNGSDWGDELYPNMRTGAFKNLRFTAHSNTLSWCAFSGSPEFDTLTLIGFKQSIVGSQQYNDQPRINRVFCYQLTDSGFYQIDIKNLGDSLEINQLHCPNIGDNPLTPQKSVRIEGGRGSISRSLLGDVCLINMLGSSFVEGSSIDGGKFIVDKSHVEIRDTGVSALKSSEVFTFANDGVNNYKASLRNITVSHNIQRDLYDPFEFDIKTSNNYQIEIDNVSRNIVNTNDPSSKQQLGVKIRNEASQPISSFNDKSHFYSNHSKISDQRLIDDVACLQIDNVALSFMTSIGPYAVSVFDGASSAYFYKAQLFWDTTRLCGRSDSASELSYTASNGGPAVALGIGTSAYSRPCTIRVYRGVSSGVYNYYVDIPIISASVLVDLGVTLSGYPWVSRSPSGVDAITSLACSGFSVRNGVVEVLATATPATGQWKKHDRVMVSPTSGAAYSYINIADGTPTWKVETTLSA